MSQDEALGPVELAVIGFPGSQFSGEIAPAVADLVASGTVSILDLLFITRDDDGTVAGFELTEVDDEIAGPYLELEGEAGALLSEEDMEAIGELLEPGSSALAIVWENTWARSFVTAVRNSQGVLLAHDRMDAETVAAALAAVESDD
jgi:Family of unknown function (DUF6325)